MVVPPIKLIFIVTILSLAGSFHFGYQVVIPNPALDAFELFINETIFDRFGSYLYEPELRILWPMFLNLFPFGGLIGSLSLKSLSEKLGRKRSFYVVTALQSLGCIVSVASYFIQSWELLAIGRFISGLSVGICMGLQPLYFSEISPKEVRGFLNAMTGTFLELGFVAGSVVALPIIFGSSQKWHWLFLVELFVTLPAFFVLPFLPESPKHILATKLNYEDCRRALVYFNHDKVQDSIEEIEEEINTEKTAPSLRTMLKKPYLRQGLLLGCLCVVTSQCSGIQAIAFYSTYLLEQAGVPADVAPYATVAITFNTFLAAVISSFFVDRLGRRPLLLVGLISLALLNLIFVIFTYIGKETSQKWPGYICVADNILFTFMFGIGPAVVSWFVIAELVPHNARSTAVSLAQVLQWTASIIANATFFPLEGLIHEWSFFMFIIILTVVSIYLFFKFPETKNKTTMEILTMLGYKAEDQEISDLQVMNDLQPHKENCPNKL